MMKEIVLGDLTAEYNDLQKELSFIEILRSLVYGKFVMILNPQDDKDIVLICSCEDKIRFWDRQSHAWVDFTDSFTLTSGLNYYEVIKVSNTPKYWYNEPGAFDEPVLCIVSDEKITPENYIGGHVRQVVSFDSWNNCFFALDVNGAHFRNVKWEYAVPVSQITTK